eukprot:TRINITY_DN2422_c0_g1_i1.p1 TRINITY_DN2422_c0_g1~~TRINITY_DN2422_c0_g1_i1.p1  ORF type:complete len:721 (-),score=181.12 TRINITY_DN2422_c0_g1_i1:17-2179(-)
MEYDDDFDETTTINLLVTWEQKIGYLHDFWPYLLSNIRDRVEKEYFIQHPKFYMSYFPQFYKHDALIISDQEFVEGMTIALEEHISFEKGEELCKTLGTYFIYKHLGLYKLFEEKLSQISDNFEEIEGLDEKTSRSLVNAASQQLYNESVTFIFVILMSVKLHRSVLRELLNTAMGQMKSRVQNNDFKDKIKKVSLSIESISNRGDSDEYNAPPKSSVLTMRKSPAKKMKHHARGQSVILPRHQTDYPKYIKVQEKEGYLEKQSHDVLVSSHNRKPWKKKWIVLKDLFITYFDDENSTEVKGCIPLYLVSGVRTSPQFGKSSFEVSTASRVFCFRSQSEQETQNWLFSVQSAIALNLESILCKPISFKHKITRSKKWWQQDLRNFKPLDYREEIENLDDLGVTEHTSQEIKSSPLKFVSVTRCQGLSDHMEDEFTVVIDTKNIKKSTNENYSFFGIFDGHGGNECSKFAKEHLLKNILNSKYVNKDIMKAIDDGFAITDKMFIENYYNEEKGTSGSTACCALVKGNKVFAINVGDSRIIVSKKGIAQPLSVDHKPSRPDERQRIQTAGGFITENKEINLLNLYKLNPHLLEEIRLPDRVAHTVGFVSVYRVMGELSVSRALGDAEYKGELKNDFWDSKLNADLVISKPEVQQFSIDIDTEFFVLASDGLWDVMDNQQVVDFVKSSLNRKVELKTVPQEIIKEAITRGSQDNITVMILYCI